MAWSICAMMHGVAKLLPESALVQSPLRLRACAHTHIHTRMRASSDARLAATRGAGRYSRRTRYQHGCASYWLTCATREVGSDSDFQCGGSSDDIVLTSPTRRLLSEGACVHLLRRVLSHLSSGLVVSRCKGRDSLHEVELPDRVHVCTDGMWHVLDIHG